jgi:hypothetical protein
MSYLIKCIDEQAKFEIHQSASIRVFPTTGFVDSVFFDCNDIWHEPVEPGIRIYSERIIAVPLQFNIPVLVRLALYVDDELLLNGKPIFSDFEDFSPNRRGPFSLNHTFVCNSRSFQIAALDNYSGGAGYCGKIGFLDM